MHQMSKKTKLNYFAWQLSGVAVVQYGSYPYGSCPYGSCPEWQLSGMAVVRYGSCPVWQLSVWQLSVHVMISLYMWKLGVSSLLHGKKLNLKW